MKRAIVWIVILAFLGAIGYYGWHWYQQRSRTTAVSYRTAQVKRQDITATISATGTVVPEDVVDVGTQVNGQVATFGKDTDGKTVDYRSTVKEGELLATIDDTVYAANVASDEASLAQAQAVVNVNQAAKEQAVARLNQAGRDWDRAQKLGNTRALSQVDFDTAKSNFEQATAAVTLADAQIRQSQAQVAGAQAALARSRQNLIYCTIKSPVTGVIIDRRVDIGQTVVSSLNAPSLFLIAKDLARMQVLVQVNEADIGQVKPNAAVTFTADAFPGESFKGTVRKVRLNATMTQNVVTYTVEIVTDNSSLRLLPYLTANVRFITDKREDVLTVPNAALRWAPADAAPMPTDTASSGGPRRQRNGDQPASDSSGQPRADRPQRKPLSRVYVLRDGLPVAVTVRPGLSDGTVTEVTTDELEDGDTVIIGENSAAASSQTTSNPFAPTMNRGGRGGGGGGGGGQRPAGGGGGGAGGR
ncbi:MAG: efflux RND transporter periplasmic adaptor subunit [Phycisphaerales bacterium]